MIKENFPKAYKEVLEILKHIPEKDFKKIPAKKIEMYKLNQDSNYEFHLDMTKSFDEQILLPETEAILANIFIDYWATPSQKEKILAKEKYDIAQMESEKRKICNPDNIFSYNKKQEKQNNFNTNSPMRAEKKNFFEKLISYIYGLLKK